MNSLEPLVVTKELVHYLAKCDSLFGSPLVMIQREYEAFLSAQRTLQRPLATASARLRSTQVLSQTSSQHNADSSTGGEEAVFVMTGDRRSLKDLHTELLSLHESYRKVSAELMAKDHRILRLQEELSEQTARVESLRRGITSTHVANASAIEDSDLLREVQILNAKMADQIAAFEDNFDVGGVVDIAEMQMAIQELTQEKENLAAKNCILAAKLLEVDEVMTQRKERDATREKELAAWKHKVDSLEAEIAQLKSEVAHLVGKVS